jgi:hypothetical protein
LAAPTYQAISAQKPTPMNPDTAGWTDSRRTSRQIRISAATTSGDDRRQQTEQRRNGNEDHHRQRRVDQSGDAAHLCQQGLTAGLVVRQDQR